MESGKGIRRWRAAAATAGCLGVSILALLLWGKLKLVTGVPRTAYADPKAAAPAERATPQRAVAAPKTAALKKARAGR